MRGGCLPSVTYFSYILSLLIFFCCVSLFPILLSCIVFSSNMYTRITILICIYCFLVLYCLLLVCGILYCVLYCVLLLIAEGKAGQRAHS